MYKELINQLTESILNLGYLGIFLLMFLESSFFPFPSEIVMIPAGYLAQQNKFNIYLVILMGTLGSIFGALFNYYLAKRYGKKFLLKIKLIKRKHLEKVERYFNNHGSISTFNGRLIPVIRQYISFPAGLSNMNIYKFILFTGLGASIWVTILTLLGYFIGENQELINQYLNNIIILILILITIISIIYYYFNKKQN